MATSSQVWVGTTNKILASLIDFFDDGDAHMAIISNQRPGMWLDARAGGIKYREPELNLLRSHVITLPFDIEPAGIEIMKACDGYNYRGVIAKALHTRWRNPNRKFCDEFVLAAMARTGYPVVKATEECLVSPWEAKLIINAALRGMAWMSKPQST